MITVWRIALDPSRAPSAADCALLSAAEMERASHFLLDEVRHRWLQAHVAYRRILGAALGVDPGALVFGATAQGKPVLRHPASARPEFNWSDSADLALLAVSDGAPVGVDVEAMRAQPRLEAMAATKFAPEEGAALLALPSDERPAAFYRIWTRKEACLKALGVGIDFGLKRFAVSIDDGPARVLRMDGAPYAAEHWTVRSIGMPDGYTAAVATLGPMGPVTVREAARV